MSGRKELGLSQIRSLALEAISAHVSQDRRYSIQMPFIVSDVNNIAWEKGTLPKGVRLNGQEELRLMEVIHGLRNEGILMWGAGVYEAGPPFMRLTEYGKKVLESNRPVPNDPEGYMERFKVDVSDANELTLMYLEECLQTYQHNNLLSASVMLGVSAEAAFYDLFDTIRKSLTNPKKIASFQRLENEISTIKQFNAVMDEIRTFKKHLPNGMDKSVENNINGIFNVIRLQRNDTGHPTGRQVTKDEVFGNLLLFRMYCKDLYTIVKWVKDNPGWEGYS